MDDRVEILWLRRRDVIAVLTGKAKITNIPDGAVPEAVEVSFQRDAIGIRLAHDSFERVADGAEIRNRYAEVRNATDEADQPSFLHQNGNDGEAE